MKAKRRFISTGSDSLDLLLDTICNAFGGIVLIAILITLLTRDTRDRIEEQASSVDRELIERQIAALQSDIKEAQEYLERQAKSVTVDPSLSARLTGVRGALQTAKGRNEEAWNAWQTSAARASGKNPEADQALSDKTSIESRLSRLKTENLSLKEKQQRLKVRLDTLQRERTDIIASKAEQLRLPKEQAERGGHMFVLLKHNEIYPLSVAEGSEFSLNDYSLEWEKRGSDGFAVTPIQGKGVKPSSVESALGETLELMAREGKYAALDVDSKSVEAYRSLRRELLARRIPFGWSYDERPRQIFSPQGSVPPPL
jgi:hypothetical protein